MRNHTVRHPPPFADISAVVEYLENTGELRNYCDAIASGESSFRGHIYYHIKNINEWLASRREYDARPTLARMWVDEANKQIADACRECRLPD
jgi:hypothetical protein